MKPQATALRTWSAERSSTCLCASLGIISPVSYQHGRFANTKPVLAYLAEDITGG